MKARHAGDRCPWCGRAGRECWILPCLTLETALIEDDEPTIQRFARAVGARLEKTPEK